MSYPQVIVAVCLYSYLGYYLGMVWRKAEEPNNSKEIYRFLRALPIIAAIEFILYWGGFWG